MSYVQILRRRWRTLTAVALVVIGLSALLTLLAGPMYTSSTQFFVSTADSANSSQLAQGGTFTQQRVKSYSELLKSPKLLDPVIAKAGIDAKPGALADKIAATTPPDTVLIDVTVTDSSAATAKNVAQAIAEVFPAVVADLERVTPDAPSPVKVTLLREPIQSDSPVSPRPLRNIALGIVLGLLLGFGAAVLKQFLDTKLRSKEDVEALTEKVVLGGIPFDADAAKHPLIIQADPLAGRAEAFRSLRTNLQFVDATNHPRVIVITSSIAGEGKSSTTANLALAMAESGASVCVVEGDLRRPRLLTYLGLEGAVGLTDVLIGRYELDDVLQPFGAHSLTVLGAGASPPNPSELLGSTAMRTVLDDLRHRFDYVLIDGAPVLPVTDSTVLTRLADGAIVVAGSGIVSKDQFGHALETFETVSATVLGIVINRIPRQARGAYDYRYEYRPDALPVADGRSSTRRRRRKSSDDTTRPRKDLVGS
ncbi:cell surface polysaccharide biosynthesis / Chain length determinant protein [Janibacter sp. HTCC2649]|uniref:polysaccharide biosynthesis tyrosine autokinase n=1 Tax=Janibacter sp. HTCC2649 TaxID=313589 RepID=UPI000067103B|nr:polysaccharide biosynthesis tyrosine autokinase [Janibacter sp. HTCC2649]EAP97401.1 cell surface polysaccharide biosynthesis / Chain length determinant protein [Janibacter sp. HTCC2649]